MDYAEMEEACIELQEKAKSYDAGLSRSYLAQLGEYKSHVFVLTGVRRCGKSTCMHQYVHSLGKEFFYVNFDDMRFANFSLRDYSLLDTIIKESKRTMLFFDEIQAAPKWESYVRQKLDEQYQVVVTGSNASLLSRELGTKLTGRHISKELFPFSYIEFCKYRNIKFSAKSLSTYLQTGGFPEYIKTKNADVLSMLANDILYRDIAVRYGVRDITSLSRLFIYCLTNSSNLISPSRLVNMVGAKSATTVLEYLSYFETAYLIMLVPKFSWSYKSQQLAPKKLYAIDTGLTVAAGASFTSDAGHFLEHFVFLELRRHTDDIFYFMDKADRECDFVVNAHGKNKDLAHPLLIQVCWKLNLDNREREVSGIVAALDFFNNAKNSKELLNVRGATTAAIVNASGKFEPEGIILTFDTEDVIVEENYTIKAIPAYKYFSDTKLWG